MNSNGYLSQWSSELAAVTAQIRDSLVQVKGRGRMAGHGAGVIWDTGGKIVTNAHVVRDRHPRVILADGREFDADVVAFDRQRDLALLTIPAHGLAPISKGNSRQLRPGDLVLSIGHPWGVLGAATAGSVIDVGRTTQTAAAYNGELIQVGLQLRPGHSGGPMVDARGHLVGINTMISGPAVGLAVPIHVVEAFIGEHQAPAQQGFI